MLPVLVLYGTTDGHTRKIADFIGDTLRSRGARTDVVEAGARGSDRFMTGPLDRNSVDD